MDTKMNDLGNSAAIHTQPRMDPPPYPGLPGPSQPNLAVVQATTVVPALVVAHSVGPEPTPFICRSCNAQIVTKVKRTPSMRTHLFAALLCIFAMWPCVFIPYCVDSCNNAGHYCPNCNAYIGTYNS